MVKKGFMKEVYLRWVTEVRGKKGTPWRESDKSVFTIWSENYEETHLVETEGLCLGVVKNKMGSQPLECV